MSQVSFALLQQKRKEKKRKLNTSLNNNISYVQDFQNLTPYTRMDQLFHSLAHRSAPNFDLNVLLYNVQLL